MRDFFASLYLSNRTYFVGGGLATGFVLSYFFPFLLPTMKAASFVWGGLTALDVLLLYRSKEAFVAHREIPDRLSNGDPNEVTLHLENRYAFPTKVEIIDEVPFQFQLRDLQFDTSLGARSAKTMQYLLRPVTRGVYNFGALNLFIHSPFSLVKRRYQFEQGKDVAVYPSFVQMKKYELLAIHNRLTNVGLKKIRRLGHTTEFEQIKEYVQGDDFRTLNWQATARSGKLMVNQYTDEKAQNVYCIIDKSRVMKMPFEGMTLLDYAINTSLVVSNIAVHKQDKAGLITFSEKIHSGVAADNKPTQMNLILDTLYSQTNTFLEADYERLYIFVKRKVNQRSLMILYTNFESLSAMRRQLPSMRQIAKNHLLLVVFFENTELKSLILSRPKTTEEVYMKAIGENFTFEKRQIVRELEQNGILAILTPPENLTINAVNKYLELKARGMI